MSSTRAFVHVVLSGFPQACRGLDVGELVALNERLDGILARHAEGFRKPSVDEAVFEGEPPWVGSGPLETPGSPLDWGAALRDAISTELHFDSSVGIAGTEVAARIAARLAGPGGVLQWISGREDELILGMPLEELDELRPEQLARLRAEGIFTLDALAGLGASEARSLIGLEGERLVGLVRGRDPEASPAAGPRFSEALERLAHRLSDRLEREGVLARSLELAIDYGDGVSRERHAPLHGPTSAPEELVEAAFRLYDLHPRSALPVVGVSLTATGLSSAEQLDLFESRAAREVRVALGRADTNDLRPSWD